MISTGAEYRRPPLKNLSRFEGAGVYYGATFVEAQLCGGAGSDCGWRRKLSRSGCRVSGGDYKARTRAGQVCRFGREHVALPDWPDRRDCYDSITAAHWIVALEGADHLEFVRWRNSQTGQTEEHGISHVFVMTGADPNTHWLDGCVALDAKGFIKTGPDLSPENLSVQDGPLPVSRICSKPVYRVFLRWAMCEAAASSVSRPRWVKDQSRSHLFIKHSRNRKQIEHDLDWMNHQVILWLSL